jgi:toxin ParE1/3/4
MATVIRSPLAQRDIVQVLKYTREKWGEAQAREYHQLIHEALLAIASAPRRGRSYHRVRPDILGHHIGQPGRPARHILFYRIASTHTVEIVRFLHDAMDFGLALSDL